MSVPSRPHRRMRLSVPTGLASLGFVADAIVEPAAEVPAPAVPIPDRAPPPRPEGASAALPPLRGPGAARRPLALTMSTVPSPGGASAGGPRLPQFGDAAGRPLAGAAAAGEAGEGATLLSSPWRPLAETDPRPRRRLRLTLPTGLGFGSAPSPDGPPLPHRVEVAFYLRQEVVERLEEEWWRRQAAGESWSRADIVQAALTAALADIPGLTEALGQLALDGGT